MGRRQAARILIHLLALAAVLWAATLIASPPTPGDGWQSWIVEPWRQMATLLWAAVLLQAVAIAVIVLRFPGDRRTLRVGLLIAAAIVAAAVNAVALSLLALLTTTATPGVDTFGTALFVTSLAGMVFVVAASLAAALAEYALLPKPGSTVAT